MISSRHRSFRGGVVGCRWDDGRGCYAWQLPRPRRLSAPIPCKGKQTFWGVPAEHLSPRELGRAEYDRELAAQLRGAGVQWVALAGFMRIFTMKQMPLELFQPANLALDRLALFDLETLEGRSRRLTQLERLRPGTTVAADCATH